MGNESKHRDRIAKLEANTKLNDLLRRWTSGDREALNELMPRVRAELEAIATRSAGPLDHVYQPTALVNEVFTKLTGNRPIGWQHRALFFSFAAEQVRRILVDQAQNHGSDAPLSLATSTMSEVEGPDAQANRGLRLTVLDEALNELEKVNPGQSKVVEMRYFGGLSHEEIAAVLGVSVEAVSRAWKMARLWLRQRMERMEQPEPRGEGAELDRKISTLYKEIDALIARNHPGLNRQIAAKRRELETLQAQRRRVRGDSNDIVRRPQ